MTVVEIAHQHNQSNAVEAGDGLFMDPDQSLLDQVDRITCAALFEN